MTTLARDRLGTRTLLLPGLLLCGLAALVAAETGALPRLAIGQPSGLPPVAAPATVTLAPAAFVYRPAGDYLQRGVAVSAPLVAASQPVPLTMMTHQVSRADYARCVADDACKPPDRSAAGPAATDLPVTGVSYYDARDYAAWLSLRTGASWRLPTVEEWDFAAGRLADDHGLVAPGDAADPSVRWLADYDRAAAERAAGTTLPQRLGSIGPNEHGIADLGGNVWEWTDTCNRRVTLDAAGRTATAVAACGVRTVEGRHRMPMSAFIRDAVRGGCSTGAPPDNLGFRLVLDRPWYAMLADRLRRLLP